MDPCADFLTSEIYAVKRVLLTGAKKVIGVGMTNGKPLGRRRVPAHDPGKEAVLEVIGGLKPLAEALGISSAAVSKWRKIPAHRIGLIEKLTGIPCHVQRPDLYREEL
jgi:Putative antitoxin of bacterial toxin-antitoxin system, YdaS/YdaT